MARQPVKEPLQTGIKAIDAMTAIGRGQRQLIIGDRQTGKTAVALDAIINQRDAWKSGDAKQIVKCVYVAIGQKGSTVAQVQAALEEAGAMEYTTIVAAPASFPAAFKYIAPYAGSAIAQHWMYNGEHSLIVFDDLSKQADAYRTHLAAAAPSGRPRGLPRRRVLPALPAARALREALRRPRRRLADRPADHRDQGQRRLGLHPDQRHLDHRRPDLPRDRPVQLRRPARDQRRCLGVPGRRQRADQGDEGCRRPAAPRPRAVSRARGVLGVRLRPRQGVEGAARARCPAGRAAQAAAVHAVPGGASGRLDLGRHVRRARRRTRSPTSRSSSGSSSTTSGVSTRASTTPMLAGGKVEGDIVEQLENAISDFKKQFETSERRGDRRRRGSQGEDPGEDSGAESDSDSDADRPSRPRPTPSCRERR